MDDHSPVTGVPMGLIFSGLLVSAVGMGLMLLISLFRQLTGRMPANELTASNAAQVE